MSAALLATLKFVFLALMWLFILFVTNVIRTDLFGRRVTTAELSSDADAVVSTPSFTPPLLTVTSGRSAGAHLVLPSIGKQVTLGRAAGADMVLDDDYASGQHAKIWSDDEGYIIDDLKSTNGTFVNDEKIARPTRFGPDDVVRIGRTHLQMERR